MHNHIYRVPRHQNELYLILLKKLTRIFPAFNGVRIAIQRSIAMATIIYVEERMEKL
jgi:hypothetical protein